MEVVNQIITGLWALVPRDPNVIIAFLGSGTVVAVLLQVVKHFGKLEEAKKTVVFLLTALSTIVAYAGDVLQFVPAQATAVFGEQVAAVLGFAVVVHRFGVSPAYYKLIALLEKFKQVFSDAKAYRAEVSGVAEPEAPAPATAPHEFSLGL
jgi:hypothetical protein